ncbi:ABC transporter ATP-binding protein [Mastigocoleus testarum]|uniref:ABC transporter ATP-binding protein n=1 Tax=Mastigocoleus testarum BC008 TaxID=371196 RepID=A0A0V7ZI50_9CYAN|nr:polysaccharide ABC transporter ATP-binding protein [Mastigocoleus testarum]KST64259.1 ABC transporter ATP-binding protein [Mastigocoleus testarum BC008]
MVSINEQETLGWLNTSSSDNAEVVLSVNGVSKKFCRDLKRSLLYGIQDIAAEVLGLREKSDKLRAKEFWTLDNVSFELRRGEALGLVGKNGSGKSTLLRIIAGLIKPDTGLVEINGRVAPLIALGAGFNPILTGRENVYANMSILGLSNKEIDERFDEVVEFAEIGDAIDAPVWSYSSRMAARLGFSSALHTEPEILLIDEVLAVGDIKFRSKCHLRLYQLRQKGISVILVSHNPQAILDICDFSVYLRKGQLITSGHTDEVMRIYEKDIFSGRKQPAQGAIAIPENTKVKSSGIDITYLCFRNSQLDKVKSPVTGEKCFFCVGYQSRIKDENLGLSLTIQEVTGEGETILSLSSFNDRAVLKVLPGKYEVQVALPNLGLRPGSYTIKILLGKDNLNMFDCVKSFRFTVEGKELMSQCLYYQARSWEVVKQF